MKRLWLEYLPCDSGVSTFVAFELDSLVARWERGSRRREKDTTVILVTLDRPRSAGGGQDGPDNNKNRESAAGGDYALKASQKEQRAVVRAGQTIARASSSHVGRAKKASRTISARHGRMPEKQ
jgi:hypothetical protein